MGRAERTYGIYAKARDMSGLRDYAVSQKTGVSSSTLTDWKKGRYTPKADKLVRIAKLLNIPVELFLEE